MSRLRNPARMGARDFDTVVYAAPGLAYSSLPGLEQYLAFETPNPAYLTRRIDLSAFADLGFGTPWPFTAADVPLNGLVCVPRGRGPFPLALFAHGNHSPLENSTPGYLYLCRLLASHGIVAATIDVNFLNGGNFGENDGRAIVQLEHVRQFEIWNGNPQHPLHDRLDLGRIMLVGHSRGGEGAGHASLFNTLDSIQPDIFSPVVPLDGSAGLGPYGFSLRAVAAIAPTDRQYEPIGGPTVVPDRYLLIHGSQDGDVSTFAGYNTYERAHAVNLANPTTSDGRLKALLWVYGANHNQFNSAWPSETSPLTTMPRADQQQIAQVYLGAAAQDLLLGQRRYRQLLRDHAQAAPFFPVGVDLVSQYQDPRRLFLMHNQESLAPPQVSAPIHGVVTAVGVTAARELRDLVDSFAPPAAITLKLSWTSPGGRLRLDLVAASMPTTRFDTLALRVGQSTEPDNHVGDDQDFTLEVSSGSRTARVPAASLHRLLYPDVAFGQGKIVMQSLRISRQQLVRHGVDPDDLRSVSLVFDRTPTGVIYVGDVQLSN